jgi:Protein of unknown function (DUF3303)
MRIVCGDAGFIGSSVALDSCHTMCPSQWPHTRKEKAMQYMIIERFKHGDAVPVYRRFRDRGRLAPDGLRYVSSWVTLDLRRCYQVMECDSRALLEEWLANWSDLVDFEIESVMTSAEALAAITPRL